MLPEEKESTVSFVCSLWESVFKISVMWGWVYSGNYPSEEKQNKSLSKLRQNPFGASDLQWSAPHQLIKVLIYLVSDLSLPCTFWGTYLCSHQRIDLETCERAVRIQRHITEKCSVCFRRNAHENDLLRMQNFNGQTRYLPLTYDWVDCIVK